MGKVVFTLKAGQSFKVGDFICHIVSRCSNRLTVCVDAPKHVTVTRHALLVRNEKGELDHPQGMVARTEKMSV
jgi:sRNA-binding carbon storage regulator CsrA